MVILATEIRAVLVKTTTQVSALLLLQLRRAAQQRTFAAESQVSSITGRLKVRSTAHALRIRWKCVAINVFDGLLPFSTKFTCFACPSSSPTDLTLHIFRRSAPPLLALLRSPTILQAHSPGRVCACHVVVPSNVCLCRGSPCVVGYVQR